MGERIEWVANRLPASDDRYLGIMAPEQVATARAFHRTFPQYAPTPLADLSEMARHLGLGGLYVKDESYRFGLNAFKVLGGSFAMARYVAQRTGRDLADVTYGYLTSEEFHRNLGQVTFYTATDGNHGRGVAWAARQLGQRAVIHMPRGTTDARRDNIAREGAQVTVEELPYDDCVRLAAREAAVDGNGVLVQDTAWDGYEEVPSWIMQGYGTIASEALDQLHELAVRRPTHVFVQAGVGSFAAAMMGALAGEFSDRPPVFVVMEAASAACLYESAAASDGNPHAASGDLRTIMAGLACGEPSTVAWDILRNHADAFLSCPDWVSARGMRMLAVPLRDDPAVTSGESGAVGMGVVATIMSDPSYAELRAELSLGPDSQVLLFSTEGDTDPDRYRRVVWDGAWPSDVRP